MVSVNIALNVFIIQTKLFTQMYNINSVIGELGKKMNQ